ncbi:upstream stimulatory factor 2 isoform X4 [Brachyhypopomus gauderio]|uniref:upstream stimulatory factor 2 isoform X4 n=1 Tax=Brachyhypopomus gauderio TaxID=698409 RepID=UPI0040415408
MDVVEQNLETSSRQKQEVDIEQRCEGVSSTGGQAAAVVIAGVPHTSSLVDHNIQYQFCPDSSRAQDVIQSPYSNGGGCGSEPVAYIPAAAVTNMAATGVSMQPSDPSLPHTGQFYVMMTTPDVLQVPAPHLLGPHTPPHPLKVDGPRPPRDERRRAQHNEVERRRRDKINNWIVTLSTIIPDCSLDSMKTGGSKGGILSKACDYIEELRHNNHTLQERLREVTRVQLDNEILRQQVEELQKENAMLRAQVRHCGTAGVRDTAAH